MTIRQLLLAVSALTFPGIAFAQVNWPVPGPVPPPPPPGAQAPRDVAEPWMARPGVPTSTQPWQSPNPRGAQANALEPIDLPPAIEQGVDMIYIDQELVPHAVQDQGPFANMTSAAWSGAPLDLFVPVNPIYTELRRGLVKYQQTWGNLPDIGVPAGPALKRQIRRRSGCKGEGVPGGSRHQGGWHCRCRHHRSAEPRPPIL